MLLIPDIHINAKHARAILHEISTYIEANADQQNIVFLGDYMYMFSYDRQALSDLLDLFLAQRHAGKNVYILAGNHDWLGQHFIYHEGKKLADILNRTSSQHSQQNNKLHFITEPETHTIEGQKILFLPYNKAFLSSYLETARNWLANNLESQNAHTSSIATTCERLLSSANSSEQLSGSLNTYLLQHTAPNQAIIHHYYMAEVKLPWQEAIFHYRDIALDPQRAQAAPLLVSGHIHKSFVYHNYLCVGSIWYTTSGERDHAKWMWKRDTSNAQKTGLAMSFHASQAIINPYLSRGDNVPLSTTAAAERFASIAQQDISLWETTRSAPIQITTTTQPLTSTNNTTIIIYTQQSASQIEATIDDTTKQGFADIQLKHRAASNEDMSELLDISQYNIQQSLTDWKELAKKYILSIYQDQSDKYYKELSDLGIL